MRFLPSTFLEENYSGYAVSGYRASVKSVLFEVLRGASRHEVEDSREFFDRFYGP